MLNTIMFRLFPRSLSWSCRENPPQVPSVDVKFVESVQYHCFYLHLLRMLLPRKAKVQKVLHIVIKKLCFFLNLNKMTVEEVSSPCKPETISTTSSYTIRVAVRSGSRSRLMEENTGTHTHKLITSKSSWLL